MRNAYSNLNFMGVLMCNGDKCWSLICGVFKSTPTVGNRLKFSSIIIINRHYLEIGCSFVDSARLRIPVNFT